MVSLASSVAVCGLSSSSVLTLDVNILLHRHRIIMATHREVCGAAERRGNGTGTGTTVERASKRGRSGTVAGVQLQGQTSSTQ
jgi:hypothetical protein